MLPEYFVPTLIGSQTDALVFIRMLEKKLPKARSAQSQRRVPPGRLRRVGCRGGAVRRRTHGWQVHHQLVHIVSEPAVLSIGTDWLMCLFSRSLPRETVGRSARKAAAALGLSACARRTHCTLLFGAGRVW